MSRLQDDTLIEQVRDLMGRDRESMRICESIQTSPLELALFKALSATPRDAKTKRLRQMFVSASDSSLSCYLQLMKHLPGKTGPNLSFVLEHAAKLINLRDGKGPYFQSRDGAGEDTSRLLPCSIHTALFFGSAVADVARCFEAIALKHGTRALLHESGAVDGLLEMASSLTSRAQTAPSSHNPWKEARCLLGQLADVQQNNLGRFLAASPEWSFEYSSIFKQAPLLAEAFRNSMRTVCLQGHLRDIEWLMLSSLTVVCSAKEFIVYKVAKRCCLVQISVSKYHPEGLLWVRTVRRQSGSWIEATARWRTLLVRLLEEKMLLPNVQLVALFLGLASIPMAASPSNKTHGTPQASSVALQDLVHEHTQFAFHPEPPAVHEHIQFVFHPDPPAVVSPIEAQQIVDIQEADFVERNLLSAVIDEEEDQIWQCTFNRYPVCLQQCLEHGSALTQCREALQLRGHECVMAESGAKVFVQPHQFDRVIHAIRHLPDESKPSHKDVFVAASLEHLLEQDLATIVASGGSIQGAWVKARKEFGLDDIDSLREKPGEWKEPNTLALLKVRRSFLCTVSPRHAMNSVVQSATDESDPSARMNPRRAKMD